MVFFLIGSVAVAVFEVDAKVFDRLARQFFGNALPDFLGMNIADADRARERERIRAVLFENAHRLLAELSRSVELEELRTAVDGVHGLPLAGASGEALHEWDERAFEGCGELADV